MSYKPNQSKSLPGLPGRHNKTSQNHSIIIFQGIKTSLHGVSPQSELCSGGEDFHFNLQTKKKQLRQQYKHSPVLQDNYGLGNTDLYKCILRSSLFALISIGQFRDDYKQSVSEKGGGIRTRDTSLSSPTYLIYFNIKVYLLKNTSHYGSKIGCKCGIKIHPGEFYCKHLTIINKEP